MKKITLSIIVLAAMALSAQAAIVAHWTFDNSSNVGEANISADLTAFGGAAYNATSQIGGGSLSVDGVTGSYLAVDASFSQPAGMPTGNSAYTISAWIKDASKNKNFVVLGNGAGYNGFEVSGGSKLKNWGGSQDLTTASTFDLNGGDWFHVVATFDPSAGRSIYVNGTLDAGPSGAFVANWADDTLLIGGASWGSYEGLLDDVAIFDEALSSVEITALHNGGLAGLNAAQAVPEPGTYALLGGFFALVCVMLRRRR